ncbi:alpha subunit of pyruvate dehydrogenase [Linnemannia exigua]|uniref:Alpha subunit of pyruvate dehydrogenase n=1 Tax=Linnemannia exigua TaxID=604196 RepID=A0AAD4DFS2_9FUNG|nr:alpha subunit of pyruvate dehydrogenase [Linnemannia exigua]
MLPLRRPTTVRLHIYNKQATRSLASAASPIPHDHNHNQSQELTLALPKNSFQTYNCDLPSLEIVLPKGDLIRMYMAMVTMRRMETTADTLYKSQLIRGFCHLCTGQEAVGVGLETALTYEDKVITAYRSHGFTYMRKGSVLPILAELLGRKNGISGGKGGSMHMFTPNFFGGNGIVGAQVPLGAGIAFAQKYLSQGKGPATFVFYGDGAANQGQVFEAFNMAKLWDLPAVNGMDVLAVRQAIAYAREWAMTDGNGPLLLEMETYRYGGHSMSDPGVGYRSREEVQKVRSDNDPITHLKEHLLENQVVSEKELKEMDKAARAEVDKAANEARNSPPPDMETFWTDVYVKGYEVPFLRGREPQEIHYYSRNAK